MTLRTRKSVRGTVKSRHNTSGAHIMPGTRLNVNEEINRAYFYRCSFGTIGQLFRVYFKAFKRLERVKFRPSLRYW
jgi:hypothetical protein